MIRGNKIVEVITPATGSVFLRDCLASVARQSYKNIFHTIVVDGADRSSAVAKQVSNFDSLRIISLPEVTGSGGFQGHRIYASMPFISNADFVAFLDEDNYYDRFHIETLVALVERFKLQWAHSLRTIVSRKSGFLFRDDCNSLGRWPSYDGGYHHIDMSCYLLARHVACKSAEALNRCDSPENGAADRILCRSLMERFPMFHTTGQYTLNYRLGSRLSEAGSIRFYRTGNEIQRKVYRAYPWRILKVARKSRFHPHLDFCVNREDEHLINGPLFREWRFGEAKINRVRKGAE